MSEALMIYEVNMINVDECLRVGVITSAHGVHGEVNVFPTTDDVKRFKKLKKVILDTGREVLEKEITSVKYSKQMVILKLSDIDDRDAAEKLRKCELLVTRDNAVKLAKDEYFIVDLVGLSVYEEGSDKLIGTLTDVITTGANDVYEITFDADFLYNEKRPDADKMYIPAIKDCVQQVDIENKRMSIIIMSGLI